MKTKYKIFAGLLLCSIFFTPISATAKEEPLVYVTFWFDTEDFILPQADDAAKRLAEMFTQRNVQATFKIVGEKSQCVGRTGAGMM